MEELSLAIGDIIVGVDIGTSKVTTVVGEVNNFNQIETVCMSKCKCTGIKKGKIINENEVAMSMAKTINDAEEEANLRINSAYVTIPGKYVTIVQNSVMKEIKDKFQNIGIVFVSDDLHDSYKVYEVEHILPDEGEHHMHCHAGKCSFTINWQGEMRPCVIMKEPAMSVFDHSFIEAWEYIKEKTSQIILSSKCNTCNKRTVCRTCAACALLETGSYQGKPEYMCEYVEETYRLLLKEKNNE